jgi:excisionase family DNA binding protein
MLSDFDPAVVPAEQIPAALSQLAAWQSALAARLMTAPTPAPAASTISDTDRMLTVKEVAERLRCSAKTVYRRVEKNEFPFARHNGTRGWIFSEQGLTKWLARQRV